MRLQVLILKFKCIWDRSRNYTRIHGANSEVCLCSSLMASRIKLTPLKPVVSIRSRSRECLPNELAVARGETCQKCPDSDSSRVRTWSMGSLVISLFNPPPCRRLKRNAALLSWPGQNSKALTCGRATFTEFIIK